MSSGQHMLVLCQQLDRLCGKKKQSEDSLLEIAALAGLLAREGQPHAGAEALRARALAVIGGIPDAVLDSLADEVESADELESEAGALDRLSAFDEVSAAFAWVGVGGRVAPYADRIADNIRAFPETWAPFAAQASRLLEDAAPCAGDPAARVWRAVEVAPLQVEQIAQAVAASERDVLPAGIAAALAQAASATPEAEPVAEDRPRRQVRTSSQGEAVLRPGQDVHVRARLSARAHTRPMAAAGLPEAPTYTQIAAANGWEVALSSGPEPGAGPVLLVMGPATSVTVQRGDEVLPMTHQGPRRSLAVEPGAYVVTVDEVTVWVTVEDN